MRVTKLQSWGGKAWISPKEQKELSEARWAGARKEGSRLRAVSDGGRAEPSLRGVAAGAETGPCVDGRNSVLGGAGLLDQVEVGRRLAPSLEEP